MPFFIIMYLLIIHEIGHFVTAFLFGVSVDKICIYPFGGISKFNMDFNINQWIEFIILIMGPLMQCVAYFILIKIDFMYSYISMIKVYHYGILFFNLLPIYPLDGGKLLNIVLSLKFSFKNSLLLSIFISYLIVFIMLFLYFKDISINIIVVVLFLIYKITFEYRRINYFYEKFLLERYLNNYVFYNHLIVDDINKFHRNREHLIKSNDKYYTEKQILQKKYKKY